MYASIRTYRFGQGSMDELMHRVDRDFADALAQEPGFIAYQVVASGEDTMMSVSIFRSQEEPSARTRSPRSGWPRISPTSTSSGWARSPAR